MFLLHDLTTYFLWSGFTYLLIHSFHKCLVSTLRACPFLEELWEDKTMLSDLITYRNHLRNLLKCTLNLFPSNSGEQPTNVNFLQTVQVIWIWVVSGSHFETLYSSERGRKSGRLNLSDSCHDTYRLMVLGWAHGRGSYLVWEPGMATYYFF